MTLTLNGGDAVLYRTWAQLMLGFLPSPFAMREADRLFQQHTVPIERTAHQLAIALLPAIWPFGSPVLYRGLRLASSHLDGQDLPRDAAYDALPALSFSEDLSVAAYFADAGPLGLPAPALLDLSTGHSRPGLPPHGYITTLSASSGDVLFHWRYAVRLPWLLEGVEADDLEVLLQQREVTIRNRPERSLRLQAFTTAAADYIAERYPAGRWIPPGRAAVG